MGKKKADYVANIFARSQVLHVHQHALDALQQHIKSEYLEKPGPIHVLYKEYFNLVDLVDRRWNSVEEHHPNHKWKSKMLFTIIRFAIMNAWVHAVKHKLVKWLQWRTILARALLEYKSK